MEDVNGRVDGIYLMDLIRIFPNGCDSVPRHKYKIIYIFCNLKKLNST